MAFNRRHVELAKSLPPPLLRFFARHPPATLRAAVTQTTPLADEAQTEAALAVQPGYETPFEVVKNPVTDKFRNPVYSLRRQADLARLAREHGVEELLPATAKSLEARTKRREEQGLKVKGTGVGQKVRGHWWERTLHTRQEARRQAMRDMPSMIHQWKEAGHGKKWKNWPK